MAPTRLAATMPPTLPYSIVKGVGVPVGDDPWEGVELVPGKVDVGGKSVVGKPSDTVITVTAWEVVVLKGRVLVRVDETTAVVVIKTVGATLTTARDIRSITDVTVVEFFRPFFRLESMSASTRVGTA